jgi:hypothetical protein
VTVNDFPIQAVLVPAIAIAVAVGFFFHRRRAVAGYEAASAGYRADVLAQRLGMALVKGDPGFNLFIHQAHVDVGRGVLRGFDTFASSGVHLVGDGRAVSFVMAPGTETS